MSATISKKKNDLKALLIQIRTDAETLAEEREEFVTHSGLQDEQFDVLNVLETPLFEANVIDPYDVVLIGGSSDVWVTSPDEYTFFENLSTLIRYSVAAHKPVFASCYGLQHTAIALGGRAVKDESQMEMGIYDINLSDERQEDPLLRQLPRSFPAVSVHKICIAELPSICKNYGSTPDCPTHVIKIKGRPFYAFQFHPEVTKHKLIQRLGHYRERYLGADDTNEEAVFEQVVSSAEATDNTDVANSILGRFIDTIVLNQPTAR